MGLFKKKEKSDMAVKIINVPELAFHSLGYEERHFVLC